MYLGFCEKSTNINFYLSRGWNEKESREFIKKRQNTYNEEYFVNKYGEQEGKIKFLEAKKKHNDTFVNNYKKVIIKNLLDHQKYNIGLIKDIQKNNL